jgi:putative DNA primase/helicase
VSNTGHATPRSENAINWSGRARQECPNCGRGPGDRTCGVMIKPDGGGVAHCFRCEYVETNHGQRSVRALHQLLAPTAMPVQHEALSEFGRDLWAACGPIEGDGLAYLRARACVIPPADGDLRYHPQLKHPPTGVIGPALVALVTNASSRRPLTLHRTWIRADGTKAPLEPPRMLLGGHRKAGGVVRLWPDEAVAMGLGIAEGIETALSLAHAFTPVWACVDAGNLGTLPVLAGIEALTIAADNDPAGIAGAHACADRWSGASAEVRVVVAADKADINDVARLAS